MSKLIYLLLIISLSLNLFLFLKNQTPAIINPFIPNYQKNQTALIPTTYKLTKNKTPFIDSNTNPKNPVLQYDELKPKIISEIEKTTNISNVGFYLQDTETGAYLGINEKEGFLPASLLKIPIMMVTLKQVERGTVNLDDLVTLTDEDLETGAGNLYLNGSGQKLTVWKLIEHMILSSDNTAKNTLKRLLSDDEINAVFAHTGIPNPYRETNPNITPREYTRLFKSLYFSTFLNPYLSEKALDITTDTQMESLLSRNLPHEIQIAHKYGERSDLLSDCGIVYEPNRPYFICIMTKNTPIPDAANLISTLSKITYNHISQVK